jgi:hypothetical protein
MTKRIFNKQVTQIGGALSLSFLLGSAITSEAFAGPREDAVKTAFAATGGTPGLTDAEAADAAQKMYGPAKMSAKTVFGEIEAKRKQAQVPVQAPTPPAPVPTPAPVPAPRLTSEEDFDRFMREVEAEGPQVQPPEVRKKLLPLLAEKDQQHKYSVKGLADNLYRLVWTMDLLELKKMIDQFRQDGGGHYFTDVYDGKRLGDFLIELYPNKNYWLEVLPQIGIDIPIPGIDKAREKQLMLRHMISERDVNFANFPEPSRAEVSALIKKVNDAGGPLAFIKARIDAAQENQKGIQTFLTENPNDPDVPKAMKTVKEMITAIRQRQARILELMSAKKIRPQDYEAVILEVRNANVAAENAQDAEQWAKALAKLQPQPLPGGQQPQQPLQPGMLPETVVDDAITQKPKWGVRRDALDAFVKEVNAQGGPLAFIGKQLEAAKKHEAAIQTLLTQKPDDVNIQVNLTIAKDMVAQIEKWQGEATQSMTAKNYPNAAYSAFEARRNAQEARSAEANAKGVALPVN